MIEPADMRRFSRDLAAMVRKADDPEGFAQAVNLADQLHNLLRDRARQLQQRDGYSSADLAGALGVTRQAAHKRWLS